MDPIEQWTDAQQRVVALVRDLSPADAERRVPACPDWTVRQLLSHMVGLGADVVAGDEPDDHNDAWTGAQVERRAGASVADLVAEWTGLTAALQQWMRDNSPRPLGDVIIHEQDLRGALQVSGAQDTPGLHAIRDRMADGFAGRVADLAPIALDGGSWRWTSDEAADPTVVVRAPAFDLARALMSRRSAAQLRSWTAQGDVERYLPAFAGLGPLPTGDLSE